MFTAQRTTEVPRPQARSRNVATSRADDSSAAGPALWAGGHEFCHRTFEVPATRVIMATARQSVSTLAEAAGGLGVTVAVIRDAVAPRGTYGAVFEGHRHAREVWSRPPRSRFHRLIR